ncbi:Calx-beta domain-containing protein [Candidatus Parabeggiatoa sp. HSG14]|uniref:Calx-beta domain-containing protein n=1 Tax=Candidatus Parabeggiatoa sp. HSG14 TaxID=3055593 RepID=UPI0025A7DEE0|nr:Calx-beta domain-containing protein [Thiotrichales bacterium HSG14]
MNHKFKYFITLMGTVLFGHPAIIGAETQSPDYQNTPNDSFLGKLGEPADASATTDIASAGFINFSKPHYNANENGIHQAKITVNRTHCSSGSPPVSVSYSSSDSTAQAGNDYQAISGRLVWGNKAEGDCLPRHFYMSVMDDAIMEGNETINLSLNNPFGGAEVDQGNAVFTIIDDDIVGNDGSFIGFSQTEYFMDEAAPFATITVERTDCQNTSLPASVSYHTTDASGDSTGTASEGRDYIGVNDVLSWGANPNDNCGIRNFNVPILDDTVVESDKMVNLHLSNVKGAMLSQNQAALTIMDNDVTSGAGVLSFSRSIYHVSESNQTATIKVNRTECGLGSPAISVSFATTPNGTATIHDYQPVKGTLTWIATGDCQPKSFQVSVKEDSIFEYRETIQLQLSNPTGEAHIEQSKAVLSINDNDFKSVQVAPDNPGIFSFSTANFSVEEGSQSALVVINRTACGSQSPPAQVTMTTSDGTALIDKDYNAVGVNLNWGKTIEGNFNGDCDPWYVSVSIRDDGIFENSETVHLHLNNPVTTPICQQNPPVVSNQIQSSDTNFYQETPKTEYYQVEECTSGKAKLDQGDAVLTIIDNDGSTIDFAATNYTVDENRKKAIITVSRSGSGCEGSAIPLSRASVSYSTNSQKPSTATSGMDYVATQGTLQWGDTTSGESCGSQQFEIPILDDPEIEGNETINLTLYRTRGASVGQKKAILTIVDDETKSEK